MHMRNCAVIIQVVSACCMLCLAPGALVTAQVETPAAAVQLVVSLHDEADAAVSGATVIVRNADVDGEVGRTVTDTQGRAMLGLPSGVASIRVELQGYLADGVALWHQPADTGGILFFPGLPGETNLALLVTADGMVIPDPAMWVLDPVPRDAVATSIPFDPAQPVATPASVPASPIPPAHAPTAPALPTSSRSVVIPPAEAATPVPVAPRTPGPGKGIVVFLAVGLIGIGGLLLLGQRRHR